MNKPICRIDITPLVGVALILVIIFMVTSPMMITDADLGVELPKAKTIEPEVETNIVISFSLNSKMALNEKELSLPKLKMELKKEIADYPERMVVIRADRKVTHKQVLNILSIAKKAGASRIALATLQRNREKV